MSDHLTASLKAFQSTLSPQEQTELSTMERAAMIAETRDLLNKARQNKGGAMGTSMNKSAQATPPPQGAPPVGPDPKIGQETTTAPVPPVTPGAPLPGDKTGQAVDTPPPVQAPPVVTGQAEAPPAAPPPAPAPPAPTPVAAASPGAEPGASGIEGYIDEKQQQAGESLSGGEMGIKEDNPAAKVAAYVEAYGHLRIRPTVKNALEVFDPQNNATLMLVRPNTATRKNAQQLRRCAVDVLASIAHLGLVKTAQKWKAQIKRADGGIVDYGTNVMQTKPKFDDDSINDRGETTMQQDLALGVDSTTGEGDNFTGKDKPETRQPAGLSGKAASKQAGEVPCDGCSGTGKRETACQYCYGTGKQWNRDASNKQVATEGPCSHCNGLGKVAQKVPEKGGILPGHDTNMADPPAKAPEGNSLSSLDNEDDNMTDKRTTKDKGSDSTLDDAITTFANETLTAGLRIAQAAQTGEPPMTMGMPGKDGGCGGFDPKQSQSPGMDNPMVPPPETQTAQGAPGAPPPPPPPMPATAQGADPNAAPGMGADVLPQTAQQETDPNAADPSMMSDEQKIAHLYRKRSEKLVAENTRKFIARFVRCLRVAARRQALNLEPNQLKIAVADALMTEAPLSKHEVYMPMDARTATFICERGLDQRNALAFVDALIKRSAAFMRMGDEALTQVEEDLENIQPVAPSEKKEGQAVPPGQPSAMPGMPQMAEPGPDADPGMVPGTDGGMPMQGQGEPGMDPSMGGMPMQGQGQGEPGMDPSTGDPGMGMEADPDPGVSGQPGGMELDNPMTQEQKAAAIRRRASGGNLPINPGAVAQPEPPAQNDKRSQVRFAVGATKNAALHNYFSRGR